MKRTRRPLAALAVVIVISACGASAPASSDTSTAAVNNNAAANAKQGVAFAKCMRTHGVSGFPDPSASGKLTIDAIANGSAVDPSTPAFTQALSACKGLEPAGFMGSRRSPRQATAALKFAQCIRANGVKDFPDPANGQPLVDTNRIPSAATSSGMSILNAAMHTCGHFVASLVRSAR